MLIETAANVQAFTAMMDEIRKRRVFAFVGAGVSRPLGYPTWRELVKELADEVRRYCGDHIVGTEDREITVDQVMEIKDPQVQAEVFKLNLRDHYFDFIRNRFGPKPAEHPSIRDLVSLPFCHFLTSNYDPGLERAHQRAQRDFDSLSLQDPAAVEFVRRLGDEDYGRRILHVHGKYDNPQKIILTLNDYAGFYNGHPEPAGAFWTIITIRERCIFFGFSFDDSDLTEPLSFRKFDRTRGNVGAVRHYALVRLQDETKEQGWRTFHNARYGIEPVFFDALDAQFSGFAGVLRDMARDFAAPAQAVETYREVAGGLANGRPELLAQREDRHGAEPPQLVQAYLERLNRLTESNLQKRPLGGVG